MNLVIVTHSAGRQSCYNSVQFSEVDTSLNGKWGVIPQPGIRGQNLWLGFPSQGILLSSGISMQWPKCWARACAPPRVDMAKIHKNNKEMLLHMAAKIVLYKKWGWWFFLLTSRLLSFQTHLLCGVTSRPRRGLALVSQWSYRFCWFGWRTGVVYETFTYSILTGSHEELNLWNKHFAILVAL